MESDKSKDNVCGMWNYLLNLDGYLTGQSELKNLASYIFTDILRNI